MTWRILSLSPRPWFPPEVLPQHGPPLLGRVRVPWPVPRRHRSYAALRLPCRVGTPPVCPRSCLTCWASVGSVPGGVTATGRPPDRSPPTARRSGSPVSPSPGSSNRTFRGLPGYRAVLFGRAAVDHPAGPPSARPNASGSAAFRVAEPLSIRDEDFEAAFLRPTRSPDYASTASSRRRLQAWLPACRLRLGWVGLAPTGRLF